MYVRSAMIKTCDHERKAINNAGPGEKRAAAHDAYVAEFEQAS
jgi:hypothetical protein